MKKIIKKYIKEFLLKEQNEIINDIQVYLDMDGVIADFDSALKQNVSYSHVANSRKILDTILGNINPEFVGMPEDRIKNLVAGVQTEPSFKALKKAYNLYKGNKFNIAGQKGFFINLPVAPGAEELFDGIYNITGKKPHILTAPLTNNTHCEEEKKQWLDNHFPNKYQSFNCTKDKQNFAKGPNTILIDDREKYTLPFAQAGGISILYKTGEPQAALDTLQKIITNQILKEEIAIQKKNISYSALVLYKEDHEKLVNFFNLSNEEGVKIYAHHVTLNMGSYKGLSEQLNQDYMINVVSYAENELVQACKVILPAEIQSKNDIPHITLAVNIANGGKPAMSNKLDWTKEIPLKGKISLKTKLVEVVQGNELFADDYV